ncbi:MULTISPECIES: YhdP family protein [unclassified Pseudomonas]|uniref:YhdP family protein n=1 Tax=unclassified Pseudomonas TaxID=196821 RepID=UPI000BC86E42|nr:MULTISPECIES: YhdP family protein [unclassified Pseudomonas]PVZ12342.1 uncharacterized protein (TIGR02099 family) [Pseudomonas sp. URIL14HWK12:I12]PVZ23506.1 uncharacterized protein (TIGR02099 family) [Pseudomonas sp. URIL14HWK12:I10]PVZ32836.1 uncharacterized protein (TIGR02099 family) [Pseudomonas sp. URIL14HWK12:I11]SNZ14225.1 TIGR02099 family protein [Pseudomonas sp. URIL14HWK12:I9]
MARLTRWLDALFRWALGLACVVLILLALVVSLGRYLVPLVGEYAGVASVKASQALHIPVAIGRLEGSWHGLAPIISAHDVTIGEGADQQRLDRVQLVPSLWRSLLAMAPRVEHLEVEGLHLSLEQGTDGRWALAGLPRRADTPLDIPGALEQLEQLGELSVLDSQLTLKPMGRDPLALTYLGLSLRGGRQSQALDVRFNLPDGQPVAAALRARVDTSNWRQSDLSGYLSLPQSDWARWVPPSLLQGWKASVLKAGGEAWADWRQGSLRSAALRLNAPEVTGAWDQRPPARVRDLALNAWITQADGGYLVQADSLAMSIKGKRWESRLNLRQGSEAGGQLWALQADRLDLAPLKGLVDAWAPLPAAAMAAVDNLNFTGSLRNVSLQWRPEAAGDRRLVFDTNLDHLGFSPWHGAPGAGSVSGRLQGDLGGGQLSVASNDGFMLHLYPIFAKPWTYQQAHARLDWRLDLNAQVFTLIAPAIRVKGDEGDISADFLIRLPFAHDAEPYMDLRVGLANGDGRFTPKYLPEVLAPSVADWLRRAVLGGKVDEGYFQYQGSLAKAAPDHARSISLFFKVRDAELDFEPGWPHARQVDGRVYIQDGAVRILADQGQILDTQVRSVDVRVPHAPAGQASHLLVDGDFDGTLANGLTILQTAPIGTGEQFAGWEGDGPLAGSLKLDVPLVKGEAPKVVVDFNTQGARLKIANPALELSEVKGDFRFDLEKGLSAQNVGAQAFGRPLNAQIFAEGQPGNPLTRLAVRSQMPVDTLTQWLKYDAPLPVSGEIPYSLQVWLGKESRLAIDSDLKGLAVSLPAPFGKDAAEPRQARFELSLSGPDRLAKARYAELANAVYLAPNGQLNEGRGELQLGSEPAQLPTEKGLRIRGSLDHFDVSAWKSHGERYAGGQSSGSAGQWLNSVNLRIGRLSGIGTTLDNAQVSLRRAGSAWAVAVDSQQVTGQATLPDDRQQPMDVRLQAVRLPAPAPPTTNDAPEPDTPDPLASVDPRGLPPVNLRIDQLYQGDELVGAWALKMRPNATGVLLSDIDLGLKGLQLQGKGSWQGAPGNTSSAFAGSLSGKNLGDVLKAWKFAPSVTSDSFNVDVDGRWPGSPAWVSPKRYSGSLDAQLKHGQFVEVEGGAQALRVFGLLNFNAIGRRLRLDFSDLLGKGLSYDQVKGRLVASDGVYVTRKPITLNGPSSNLELDGTLDMAADRIDAHLQVALPLSTNLPIAALLVGAPAVGGALFLVDKLLGDRVAKFASVNYKVQGPLKDPKLSLQKPFSRS